MFSFEKVMVVVVNLVVEYLERENYFLKLEVVEVLLEEETLVSSSNNWLIVMWRRLVIWVCNQWRMKKWLCMEFLKVHLGHLVIRLGLEMEALVDDMEVYGG
uniref:Uncharacterized protein n=1 Tax=Tanacetum cinerariifolium TaxID=118510 RepID=A0A6L2LMB2_TANCI|nr:hypothetical protein [Tanacetum cinerariifolium]